MTVYAISHSSTGNPNLRFLEEVGARLVSRGWKCVSNAACARGMPSSADMDRTTRMLFAMIRAGSHMPENGSN